MPTPDPFVNVLGSLLGGLANSPEVTAINIFRTIALNLILQPRSAYYVSFLAKNNLQAVATSELAAIDALTEIIADLANASFIPQDTSALDTAKSALLELEGLDKIDSSSPAFVRYDQAINDFLNTQLAKSVKTPGATELARSANEARDLLPDAFSSLKELHVDLLSRLDLLPTGVAALLSSPLSSIVGTQLASRIRINLDSISSLIEIDPANQSAVDIANQLIAHRAALRAIGKPVSPTDPSLSTSKKLPNGYNVTGTADDGKASATSLPVASVTLPAAASMTLQVGTSSLTFSIPQTTLDLANKASVVSKAISYPATLSAKADLYIVITTAGVPVNYRAILNSSSSPASKTLADVLSAINTALGGAGAAVEYIQSGTSRILIYANTGNSISIATHFTDTFAGQPRVFSSSAWPLVGFAAGQRGVSGSIPSSMVAEAVSLVFTTLTTSSTSIDGSITLTAKTANQDMVISGNAASTLGLAGTFHAGSTSVKLSGVVNRARLTEVDPRPVIDVGDTLTSSSGSSVISGLTKTRIKLTSQLPYFRGSVTVTSQLIPFYNQLIAAVQTFQASLTASAYSENLDTVDEQLAALNTVSAAQISSALSTLANLRSYIYTLQTSLAGITLPSTAGSNEREVVQTTISALSDRKYDRALDLLLKCDFAAFTILDLNSASYATYLMSSAEDLAQNHIEFRRNNDPLDEAQRHAF